MCQCGCGDFAAEWKLPGPKGVVYAIETYSSCTECQNPAGIIVHRMTAKSAKEWGVDKLPLLPIIPILPGSTSLDGECGIPIIDVESLTKALEDCTEEFSVRETDIARIVKDVVRSTLDNWKKKRP